MMDEEVFWEHATVNITRATCVHDYMCSGVPDTTSLRKMRVRRGVLSSPPVARTTFANVRK